MITKQQFISLILPTTLKHEGGYANVKNDKGGETYRGITRKNNGEWSGWTYIDDYKFPKNGVESVKLIPNNHIFPELEESAKNLYWEKYFYNKGFHNIDNVEIATILFDFVVHGGYSHKGLQALLNAKFGANITPADNFGQNTAKAVNAAGIALKPHLLEWRKNHLANIIAKDPTQQKFEAGWNSRLASFGLPASVATNVAVTSSSSFFARNKTVIIAVVIVVIIIAAYLVYRAKSKNNEATENAEFNETLEPQPIPNV